MLKWLNFEWGNFLMEKENGKNGEILDGGIF